MKIFQPPRGNIHVYVGVNDWGMSLINMLTHLNKSELKLRS